ncbi:hypothetical protein V8E51_013746 [Hyaloscypha variabilis]
MDWSYSSAWSLGKLADISDSPFNAALLRFRAISGAQAVEPTTFTGLVSRINPPSTDTVAPPLTHPDVAPVFAKAIIKAVDTNTSDQGERSTMTLSCPKQPIATGNSSIIGLATRSHVLFPEPTHLKGDQIKTAPTLPNVPQEALRFFYIDHAWIDSFIDGALSCANQLEPQYDTTRLRIKEVYNYYLRSAIHPLEGITPPVPRYGLGIKLIPRSAQPDAAILVTNNQQTDDASVRLTECAIAKVVNKSQVQVAGIDASGNETSSSQPQVRGVCKITLTEVYVMGDGTRQKAVTDGELRTGPGQHGVPLLAFKRDGGDMDLNGVAV